MICSKTNGGNRLRHITDVHQDYVKECVKYDRVNIEWVSTKKQLADIMTKPLSFKLQTQLRDKILNNDND